MTAVADALEMSRVDSHLHPEGSFDRGGPPGADRPRGDLAVHAAQAAARTCTPTRSSTTSVTTVEWNTPEGVRIEGVAGEEARGLRGISGLVPNTRWAARVLAEVPSTLLVDVPADTEVAEPVVSA